MSAWNITLCDLSHSRGIFVMWGKHLSKNTNNILNKNKERDIERERAWTRGVQVVTPIYLSA